MKKQHLVLNYIEVFCLVYANINLVSNHEMYLLFKIQVESVLWYKVVLQEKPLLTLYVLLRGNLALRISVVRKFVEIPITLQEKLHADSP